MHNRINKTCNHIFGNKFTIFLDTFEGVKECTKCGSFVYKYTEQEELDKVKEFIRKWKEGK